MPYLELPDCNVFYTIDDHTDAWTKPETVLFVHGFTETSEAWRAWQKTIPGSELVILPIDGYHAAGTDPDATAQVTLDFIAKRSANVAVR